MAIRKHEQISRVLGVLKANKDGLTSRQIATLTGERLRRDVLIYLRKEGKIKHKRGLTDGRISLLYVLNENKPAS